MRPRTVAPASTAPPGPAVPPPAPAQAPQPIPVAVRQGAAPGGAHPVASDGMLELLNALGLEAGRVDPSIFHQLGTIIRSVVQGMIEVLQARAEVKNNFRMPMTSIRPIENNPLKFSLNADDALHNLFVKRNPGYLGPLDSFQEGFQDISFHQVAMLAGIRAAYNSMLEKFKPEHLEAMYERKLRRTSMIGFGHRAKFWALYREQFEDIDKDMEANFQLLFGEEFAKAYNDQLNKLTAAARSRPR
jgi:type VI secretion system FHA domain protein